MAPAVLLRRMRTAKKVDELLAVFNQRAAASVCFIFGFAYVLSWTSASLLLNIPVAALVLGLLLSLQAAQLHNEEGQLRAKIAQQANLKTVTALLEHSQCGMAGDEIWRDVLGCEDLAREVQALCARIVKEFVSNLWYSYISSDAELPHECENKLALVAAIVIERIRKVDAGRFVISNLMDLLVYQLEWFHRAKEYVRRRAKVNDEILIHNSMEERAQIEDVLVSSSELHPAIRSPENETRILRTLSEGVCALLLNRTEAECSMVRILIRECLAFTVVKPTIDMITPTLVNKEIARWCSNRSSTFEMAQMASSYQPVDSFSSRYMDEVYYADLAPDLPAQRISLIPGTSERGFDSGRSEASIQTDRVGADVIQGRAVPIRSHRRSFSNEELKWVSKAADAVHDAMVDDASPTSPILEIEKAQDSPLEEGELSEADSVVANDDVENSALEMDEAYSVEIVDTEIRRPAPKAQKVAGDGTSRFPNLLGKSYVVYIIRVSRGNSSWLIFRRYRTFESLHKKLKIIPSYRLRLPPKRTFKQLDNRHVDIRRTLLQGYLSAVLSDSLLSNAHEVQDFVAYDSVSYGLEDEELPGDRLVNPRRSAPAWSTQSEHRAASHTDSGATSFGRDRRAWSQSFSLSLPKDTDTPTSQWPLVDHRRTKSSDFDSHDYDDEYQGAVGQDETPTFGDRAGVLPGDSSADVELLSNTTKPLYLLVKTVFRLPSRGWLTRKAVSIARQILKLMMGDAVDVWVTSKVSLLRSDASLCVLVRSINANLFPKVCSAWLVTIAVVRQFRS